MPPKIACAWVQNELVAEWGTRTHALAALANCQRLVPLPIFNLAAMSWFNTRVCPVLEGGIAYDCSYPSERTSCTRGWTIYVQDKTVLPKSPKKDLKAHMKNFSICFTHFPKTQLTCLVIFCFGVYQWRLSRFPKCAGRVCSSFLVCALQSRCLQALTSLRCHRTSHSKEMVHDTQQSEPGEPPYSLPATPLPAAFQVKVSPAIASTISAPQATASVFRPCYEGPCRQWPV